MRPGRRSPCSQPSRPGRPGRPTHNGASAAALASVLDTLPAGVSLVPGSITVTSGAPSTVTTDAAGDSTGEYDAASRDVRVRVGAGASNTLGGTLAAGASITVAFDVIVDSITAVPSIENTATVAFTDTLTSVASVSTSTTTTTTTTPDAAALSIVTTGTVTPAERQSAAALGDIIVGSHAVSNTGDVPLTGVSVIDPEGGTITCVPTTCEADAIYTITDADADALARTSSRTIRAAGVAADGIASTSVSDQQIVSLDVAAELPTLCPPEDDELGLAATGANIGESLALALALVGAGLATLAAARLTAVRRARRGSQKA